LPTQRQAAALPQLALLHVSRHVSCTSGCDVTIKSEQVTIHDLMVGLQCRPLQLRCCVMVVTVATVPHLKAVAWLCLPGAVLQSLPMTGTLAHPLWRVICRCKSFMNILATGGAVPALFWPSQTVPGPAPSYDMSGRCRPRHLLSTAVLCGCRNCCCKK
jgi:hypothetical protein